MHPHFEMPQQIVNQHDGPYLIQENDSDQEVITMGGYFSGGPAVTNTAGPNAYSAYEDFPQGPPQSYHVH